MRRALATLGAAVFLAAGCSSGGGGDGDGSGDERLTKEEYVEQADAICTRFEERLDKLGDPRTIAELGDVAEQALPIAREGVAELRALKPPEELRATVRSWLRLNDANVRRIEALGRAARAGDEDRVQEIARAAAAAEGRADALAKKLGLVACAQRE